MGCDTCGWGFNLNKTCGTTIYEYDFEEDSPSGMFNEFEEALEKGLYKALGMINVD